MRGAKRLTECFALAKHSSEDYYRSGQNYFRSGYVSIYLTDIGQNTHLTHDFCEHTWRIRKSRKGTKLCLVSNCTKVSHPCPFFVSVSR